MFNSPAQVQRKVLNQTSYYLWLERQLWYKFMRSQVSLIPGLNASDKKVLPEVRKKMFLLYFDKTGVPPLPCFVYLSFSDAKNVQNIWLGAHSFSSSIYMVIVPTEQQRSAPKKQTAQILSTEKSLWSLDQMLKLRMIKEIGFCLLCLLFPSAAFGKTSGSHLGAELTQDALCVTSPLWTSQANLGQPLLIHPLVHCTRYHLHGTLVN